MLRAYGYPFMAKAVGGGMSWIEWTATADLLEMGNLELKAMLPCWSWNRTD